VIFNFFKKTIINLLRLKSDFHLIFFQNEYQVLAGNSNGRIKSLFAILFLTFLALSFAIGSVKYLKVKMDNPFTNWVDMPVRYEYQDKVNSIRQYFNVSDNSEKVGLKSITQYSKFSPEVYHFITNERHRVLGMTLDPTGDLIKRVLGNIPNSKEMFTEDGSGLKDSFLSGVIVTKRMLEELGCEHPDQQRLLVFDDENYRKYVPILAVVESLPSLSDFACTPRLYNWMTEKWETTNCIESQGKVNALYMTSDISKVAYFEEISNSIPLDFSIEQQELDFNSKDQRYKYRLAFNSWFTLEERMKNFHLLKKSMGKDSLNTFWLADWKCTVNSGTDQLDNPYYLAYNFNKLDEIRQFKEVMQNKFGVEISMNQVESKENFMIISRLTFVISIILFVFVLISISLYTRNLLVAHLEKNKSNLGTFKAFGLDNEMLVNNYRNIIISFISLSVFLAFLLTWFIERLEYFFYKEESVLILFNPWIYLAILLLFGMMYFSTSKIINSILAHTPGDLIYNRE